MWKKPYSNILWQLEIATKFDRMRTTDGEHLLRREYPSSRSYPKTSALSVIPAGTIIGPVLEVHIVKIYDGYAIEVAI